MNSAEIILQSYRKILSLPSERVADVGVSVPIPCFPAKLVYSLLKISIKKISKRKKPLIDNITGKCVIVGDLHGNLHDLIRILNTNGLPPAIKYVFLGDYVDRGDYSIEVIVLLTALSYLYPDHIYLLRGNHELREVNSKYGFYDDINHFYTCNFGLWNMFNSFFDYLPLAAIIEGSYFCVHGGLSPFLTKLSDISNIQLPLFSIDPLSEDLLWSDPTNKKLTFALNKRGKGHLFGQEAINQFLHDNQFLILFRGHQTVRMGIDVRRNGKVVTIYSASNMYSGASSGYVLIDGDDIDRNIFDPLDFVRKYEAVYECIPGQHDFYNKNKKIGNPWQSPIFEDCKQMQQIFPRSHSYTYLQGLDE